MPTPTSKLGQFGKNIEQTAFPSMSHAVDNLSGHSGSFSDFFSNIGDQLFSTAFPQMSRLFSSQRREDENKAEKKAEDDGGSRRGGRSSIDSEIISDDLEQIHETLKTQSIVLVSSFEEQVKTNQLLQQILSSGGFGGGELSGFGNIFSGLTGILAGLAESSLGIMNFLRSGGKTFPGGGVGKGPITETVPTTPPSSLSLGSALLGAGQMGLALGGTVLAGSEAGNKEVLADPEVQKQLTESDRKKQENIDKYGILGGSIENFKESFGKQNPNDLSTNQNKQKIQQDNEEIQLHQEEIDRIKKHIELTQPLQEEKQKLLDNENKLQTRINELTAEKSKLLEKENELKKQEQPHKPVTPTPSIKEDDISVDRAKQAVAEEEQKKEQPVSIAPLMPPITLSQVPIRTSGVINDIPTQGNLPDIMQGRPGEPGLRPQEHSSEHGGGGGLEHGGGISPGSDFSKEIYKKAIGLGIPEPQARLAAAQAQIESAGGTSHVAKTDNNLFGMKGRGDAGSDAGRPGDGDRQGHYARYSSTDESLKAWWTQVKKHWPEAAHAKTIEEAASGLHAGSRGGYAEDPNYISKILPIMRGISTGVDIHPDLKEHLKEATGSAANAENAVEKLLGDKEVRNNSDIRSFLRDGGIGIDPHKLPWCAATVSAALKKQGIDVPAAPLLARSYLKWGQHIDPKDAQKGDVMVTGSHVGFFTGERNKEGQYQFIAGNEIDSQEEAGPGRSQAGKIDERWVDPGKFEFRRSSQPQHESHQEEGNKPSENASEESAKIESASFVIPGSAEHHRQLIGHHEQQAEHHRLSGNHKQAVHHRQLAHHHHAQYNRLQSQHSGIIDPEIISRQEEISDQIIHGPVDYHPLSPIQLHGAVEPSPIGTHIESANAIRDRANEPTQLHGAVEPSPIGTHIESANAIRDRFMHQDNKLKNETTKRNISAALREHNQKIQLENKLHAHHQPSVINNFNQGTSTPTARPNTNKSERMSGKEVGKVSAPDERLKKLFVTQDV